MERTILFRGIIKYPDDIFKGFWYGNLIIYANGDTFIMQIETGQEFEVIPETVGEFTGLTDKNDVKVFVGDLLRFPPKSKWEEINYRSFEVFFHDGDSHADYNIGYTMCRTYNHGSVCGGYIPSFKHKTVGEMVVIGNIHDKHVL